MAGIGFELKKLFRGNSILSRIRAYGYTGMITTGPLLLGILFLLSITGIGQHFDMPRHDLDLLVSMITYDLLASILLTGISSIVSTRYIADMLYEGKDSRILSSLRGNLCLLLPAGGVLWAVFLCFSGINFSRKVLVFLLFMFLLTVWVEINYLTAIKNYRGILLGYVSAIGSAFGSAWLFSAVFGASLEILLGCCCIGYGVMMAADLALVYRFFPDSREKPFLFLKWFDAYRELVSAGLLLNVGLFSHLIIAWFGRGGERIQGLFFAAPQHDIPALFAFLTVIITTINFVAATEVRFYPVYRNYYDLFNGTGSIDEISRAKKQMLHVLEHELSYAARIQFYTTAAMISIGTMILNTLPFSFTDLMDRNFRILCVGYGAYAVGNVLMLILMYFADDHGAATASRIFAGITTAGSVIALFLPVKYYGFAFTAGAIAYLFYSWKRLNTYIRHMEYYILSIQPIVAAPITGFFTRLEERLDAAAKHFLPSEKGKSQENTV